MPTHGKGLCGQKKTTQPTRFPCRLGRPLGSEICHHQYSLLSPQEEEPDQIDPVQVVVVFILGAPDPLPEAPDPPLVDWDGAPEPPPDWAGVPDAPDPPPVEPPAYPVEPEEYPPE